MAKTPLGRKQKLAPWIRIAAPALGVFLGMIFWVNTDEIWAALVPVLLFFAGSYIGNSYFDKWASLDQKKEDIRHRIDTE